MSNFCHRILHCAHHVPGKFETSQMPSFRFVSFNFTYFSLERVRKGFAREEVRSNENGSNRDNVSRVIFIYLFNY